MSMKKIKVIKVIRLLLLSFYIYYMFNSSEFNTSHRNSYILVNTMLFLCGLGLTLTLPKEYQSGNTFLKRKYMWFEVGLEIVVMFGLSWLLCQF
ncbi:hypothetical protein IGI43_001636 [Enterococcus sp. AZ126]